MYDICIYICIIHIYDIYDRKKIKLLFQLGTCLKNPEHLIGIPQQREGRRYARVRDMSSNLDSTTLNSVM